MPCSPMSRATPRPGTTGCCTARRPWRTASRRSRCSPRSATMHRLVELAADDVASRRFGRLTTALALVGLNEDRGCSPLPHSAGRSPPPGQPVARPGRTAHGRPPAAADGRRRTGAGRPRDRGLRPGPARTGLRCAGGRGGLPRTVPARPRAPYAGPGPARSRAPESAGVRRRPRGVSGPDPPETPRRPGPEGGPATVSSARIGPCPPPTPPPRPSSPAPPPPRGSRPSPEPPP